MCRPVVTLAVTMAYPIEIKKLATRAGETKNRPSRSQCGLVVMRSSTRPSGVIVFNGNTVALCALFNKECCLKDEHLISPILKSQRGGVSLHEEKASQSPYHKTLYSCHLQFLLGLRRIRVVAGNNLVVAFTKLRLNFFRDQIDRRVKVVFVILRKQIRTLEV